jgi:hypothetical protein
MIKILEHMLGGFQDSFAVLGQSGYVIPSKNGFEEDAQRLRGDFATVAGDVKKVMARVPKENGEANSGAR